MDTTSFDKTKTEIDGPMHASLRHDSAHKHVTGSAEYIDDIPEPMASFTARSAFPTARMPKSSPWTCQR